MIWSQVNSCRYWCECTQDTFKMNWDPVAQTTFRGGVGHIWPRSFSSVYTNVSTQRTSSVEADVCAHSQTNTSHKAGEHSILQLKAFLSPAPHKDLDLSATEVDKDPSQYFRIYVSCPLLDYKLFQKRGMVNFLFGCLDWGTWPAKWPWWALVAV